jgi:hypothetical protein
MKNLSFPTLLAIGLLGIHPAAIAEEASTSETGTPDENKEVAAFVQDEPPMGSQKKSKRSMRVAAFGTDLDGDQLDAIFYDNGGEKIELFAGRNSLSSEMPMPRGETMTLYKKVEQPIEGSTKTRVGYLDVGSVEMTGDSKAIILLLVPEDTTKGRIRGRAFKDSYTLHPAETARVFNMSTKEVAIRAGKESLQLPVGGTGIMPWKAVAFNSVSYQVGTAGKKEGTWDLVESSECAARADLRTFAFITEVVVDSKRTVTTTTVFDPLPDENEE